MKFYEFGETAAPVILLLPGTCCHWRANFGEVIPLLERELRVVCASYDGFDETEDSVFPTMLDETEKIEDYLQMACGGSIRAAYSCSLGGSFAGLLVQRGKIHIDHAILGSSDLDQDSGLSAKVKARLAGRLLCSMLQKGRAPGFMRKWLDKQSPETRPYYEKMVDMFGINSGRMSFVRRESVYNQFYSDLVTPLEDGISAPGTTVHIFYALKMGQQYEALYRRHFQAPDIRRYDLQHEELLVCRPRQWAEEVLDCCGMGERAEARPAGD